MFDLSLISNKFSAVAVIINLEANFLGLLPSKIIGLKRPSLFKVEVVLGGLSLDVRHPILFNFRKEILYQGMLRFVDFVH